FPQDCPPPLRGREGPIAKQWEGEGSGLQDSVASMNSVRPLILPPLRGGPLLPPQGGKEFPDPQRPPCILRDLGAGEFSCSSIGRAGSENALLTLNILSPTPANSPDKQVRPLKI